jgi:hypothetical protein
MGGKGNRNGSKLRCQRDPSCGAVGKREMEREWKFGEQFRYARWRWERERINVLVCWLSSFGMLVEEEWEEGIK